MTDGRLVVAAERDGRCCVLVDGFDVTPHDVQVRSIAHAGTELTFLGNPIDDATVQHVYRWDGIATSQLTQLDGVHTVSTGRAHHRPRSVAAARPVPPPARPGRVPITSFAERPLVRPIVTIHAPGRPPAGHGGAAATRSRRLEAAGAARSVRRPGAQRVVALAQRLPQLAVVRRPGIRRGRHRRARHARAWHRLGARRGRRSGHTGARRPDRRVARGGRTAPRARPRPRRDPRLELRRLPGRARPCCNDPTCSTPRSRAHPSPSGGCTTPTTPSATWATRRSMRARTRTPACCRWRTSSLGRCCSSTASPTTTWWPRTACSCRRRCWRRASHTSCSPLVGRVAHDAAGSGGREPVAAPTRLPARAACRLRRS